MNTENSFAEQLARLKRAAMKATPGPWQHADPWNRKNGNKHILTVNKDFVSCHGFAATRRDEDGDYIALANPQTILNLIAEVERLRDLERGHMTQRKQLQG
jgi:hypothetical protein